VGRKQKFGLEFPLAGIDRRVGWSRQKPYTTPHAINVRPDSSVEGRASGGSRFGLIPYLFQKPWVNSNPDLSPEPGLLPPADLFGDELEGPVNGMAVVSVPSIFVQTPVLGGADTYANSPQLQRLFVETFNKPEGLGSNWSQAGYIATNYSKPSSWRGKYVYAPPGEIRAAGLASSASYPPIDQSQPWMASIYIPYLYPYTADAAGTFSVNLRWGTHSDSLDVPYVQVYFNVRVDSLGNMDVKAAGLIPDDVPTTYLLSFESSWVSVGKAHSAWLTLYSTGNAAARPHPNGTWPDSTGGIVAYFNSTQIVAAPWYNNVYPSNISNEFAFFLNGDTHNYPNNIFAEMFRVDFFESPRSTSTLPTTDATSAGQLVAISNTKLFRALYPRMLEYMDNLAYSITPATDTPIRVSIYDRAPIQAAHVSGYVCFADYGPILHDGESLVTQDGSICYLTLPAGITGTDLTDLNRQDWDIEIYQVSPGLTLSTYAGTYSVFKVDHSTAANRVYINKNWADTTPEKVHFRIVRGTKMVRPDRSYQPLQPLAEEQHSGAGGLYLGTGFRPVGCRAVCAYRNRLVLAGSPYAPAVVHASRVNKPLVWDYDGSASDQLKAWAEPMWHTSGELQVTTCVAPWRNDYLIIGCERSIFVMRGDIGVDGSLNAVSITTGVISHSAWCHLPDGTFFFLSHAGLRFISPGANTSPEVTTSQQLSKSRMPTDLINVDPESTIVLMAYDHLDNGVHIFLTPKMGGVARHWWYSIDHQSFWEDRFADEDHNPWSLLSVAGGLLLGCFDGKIRRYYRNVLNDGGTLINSEVVIGPFALGDGYYAGIIHKLRAVLGEDSSEITWEFYAGNTAQEAAERAQYGAQSDFSSTPDRTGSWTAGDNFENMVMRRGMAGVIKLKSTMPWRMESLMAIREIVGMNLKL
jgi:hypothetical protein